MNDLLKFSTKEFKIAFEKPDINSHWVLVFSVLKFESDFPDSIKPGVHIVAFGGTSVAGLGLEDIKVLVTEAASTGELYLKLADTGSDVRLKFSPQATCDASCVTIGKGKEMDNLRLIHRRAYCPTDHPPSRVDSHIMSSSPTPQINFKPKRNISSANNLTSSNASVQHFGAVASLALDGGLTAAQLHQIGTSSGTHAFNYSNMNCNYNNFMRNSDQKSMQKLTVNTDRKHLTNRLVYYPPAHKIRISPNSSVLQDLNCGNGSAVHQIRHTSRVSHWSTSRGTHTTTHSGGNSRRGSFPVQMTRVGGLVVSPVMSTASTHGADVNSHSPQKTVSTVYHSASVCSSPVNLKSIDSASHTFFPCTNSQTQANVSLVPSSTISDSLLSTDIVRLGPGDTVTRAPANSKVCDATNLIRMHCCPQPYISMGPTSEECQSMVSTTAVSSQNSPILLDNDPSAGIRSDLSATRTGDHISQDVDNSVFGLTPNENSTTFFTNHSPVPATPSIVSTPVSSFVDVHSPVSRTHIAYTNSTNSSQIVRTVRHLRRIRHIFGDPIGYNKSTTSASMGTLTMSDKEGNANFKLYPNGYRSVESVRPGLSCDCPKPTSIDLIDSQAQLGTHCRIKVLFRFDHGLDENLNVNVCWKDYYFHISNGTLILTLDSSSQPIVHQSDSLDHIHIPLSDSTWQWHSPMELFNSCIKLPEFEQSFVPDNNSDNNNNKKSIGVLNNLKLDLICYFYFPDRQLATLFVDYFGEPGSQTFDTKITKAHTNSGLNFIGFRSKFSTGSGSGRANLGLAGPPGVTSLVKAAGTAAASIGMPLRECAPMHTSSFSISSTVRPSSSPANGEVNKFKADNADSSTSSSQLAKLKESKFSHTIQRGRGRLHQAITRMRRAATASYDPISRSTTNVETRRFASSHGGCSKMKSHFTSPPSSNFTESDDMLLFDEDNVSVMHASATHCVNHSSPTSVLLAASVSPSPSLQTSCLTYGQHEANSEATGDLSTFDQETAKPNDLICNQSATNVNKTKLAQNPSADIGVNSTTLADGPRFGIEHIVLTQAANMTTKTITTSKIFHSQLQLTTTSYQHSFIPLPSNLSEPLPLHKCPRSTLSAFVPFVVELCVTLVERYGLNCVGLYRLSGSKVAHDFIAGELNKNITTIDVTSDKWNDLHAVCGVLKTFLRNLPDSLFPKVMYPDFLAACRLPQRERRLLSIQRLLSIMECYPSHPEYRAHRATLRYLATHLARVSAREAVNRMTAYNLALVFAPNLVQPCEDSPELLISDSKYKIMLVELVIKYHAWIFSPDLGLESGCSVPPDSTENLTSELDVAEQSVTNPESDDSVPQQPGRIEGDVKPLVSELLIAAANLPPPPSDTDLETAEIPGPESDRPSDITVDRSRQASNASLCFHSQLNEAVTDFSSTTSLITQSRLGSVTTVGSESEAMIDRKHVHQESMTQCTSPLIRPTPNFGLQMDSLRNLSQGCLDEYSSEARKLGVRVAESKRQLQSTVAQRLHAQQLLSEARGENLDFDLLPAVSTASFSPCDMTTAVTGTSSVVNRNIVINTTESVTRKESIVSTPVQHMEKSLGVEELSKQKDSSLVSTFKQT